MMRNNHQRPDEAVQGMMLSKAYYALGHHWGTFQLTDEDIEAPRQALEAALAANGIEPERFKALRPGEGVSVPVPGR